jgi:mRNA interferase MazF
MNVQQQDIFLVPFPFSDFSGKKVRPVLVLSKDSYNSSSEDVLVCGITTNTMKEKYSVIISTSDMEEGHLFEKSLVKAENILRIDKRLLIKKIGKVNEKKLKLVLKEINKIFTD